MILHDCNIWASLPVPTLLIGADDTIAELNPAGEVFMNTTIKTLKGQPLWERLLIDAPMEQSFARVRANQSALFLNDVDVSPSQRAPVQCNVQIAPMTGADAPEGMLMLLISPREIAGRLGRSLQVETAAKSAIGMAEMLTHEIKNPLAGITGAAQLLSMGLTKDDLELADLIVGESRRIVKLLEQVEQFGNLSPPQRRAVNIHDLLDRARRSARVGFAAHMEISDEFDPSLPATFADGDQLLQVFLNLLKNAAEASKGAPGKIRLRTYYEGSLRVRRRDGTHAPVPLQVEIIDDGPGLPPSIAAEVFEPFVSGRDNGTGLGLALVSKIVLDHEGWVTVDSVPGRTAFRISLPVAPASVEIESNGEQD